MDPRPRRLGSGPGTPRRARAHLPSHHPEKRIDFVTATPDIEVLDVTTQHDPTQVVASDHRAVVATVLLDQGSELTP